MTENDPAEQVAVMRDKLDGKRKAAKNQLSASKQVIENSTIAGQSPPMDLRDLLNKLRLTLRGDQLVAEDTVQEDTA